MRRAPAASRRRCARDRAAARRVGQRAPAPPRTTPRPACTISLVACPMARFSVVRRALEQLFLHQRGSRRWRRRNRRDLADLPARSRAALELGLGRRASSSAELVVERGHGSRASMATPRPWPAPTTFCEGGRIADREVGEDLAVELDVGALAAPPIELRVADAVHARGGVDAHDPQGAEVALALAAVPRGEAPGVVDRVDHRLPQLASARRGSPWRAAGCGCGGDAP